MKISPRLCISRNLQWKLPSKTLYTLISRTWKRHFAKKKKVFTRMKKGCIPNMMLYAGVYGGNRAPCNYRRLTNDLFTTETKPTNGLLTDRLKLTRQTNNRPIWLTKTDRPMTDDKRYTDRRSHYTNHWYSWVQTIYYDKKLNVPFMYVFNYPHKQSRLYKHKKALNHGWHWRAKV